MQLWLSHLFPISSAAAAICITSLVGQFFAGKGWLVMLVMFIYFIFVVGVLTLGHIALQDTKLNTSKREQWHFAAVLYAVCVCLLVFGLCHFV